MPTRCIDFESLWSSDKLAACAPWAQAEYAWLYGLADANGSFEMTNLRVIWGRVAAIRKNLSVERLEQVFAEFQDKGLLFIWEQNGKRYGHWTGSDRPGRLPRQSVRGRYARLAPVVPQDELSSYAAQFSNGHTRHDELMTLSRGGHDRIGEGLEKDTDTEEETESTADAVAPSKADDETLDDGFEGFWKLYPRHEGKQAAHGAWGKLTRSERSAVIVALDVWKRSDQWLGDGGRYVPYAQKFLNRKNRLWEDVPFRPGQNAATMESEALLSARDCAPQRAAAEGNR